MNEQQTGSWTDMGSEAAEDTALPWTDGRSNAPDDGGGIYVPVGTNAWELRPYKADRTISKFAPQRPSDVRDRPTRWRLAVEEAQVELSDRDWLLPVQRDAAGRPPESPTRRQPRSRLVRTLITAVAVPAVLAVGLITLLQLRPDISRADIQTWMDQSVRLPVIEPLLDPVSGAILQAGRAGDGLAPGGADIADAPPAGTAAEHEEAGNTGGDGLQRTGDAAATDGDAAATGGDDVSTVRLAVADTHGPPAAAIPLGIAVQGAEGRRMRIRISGVPEGARLSAGTELGNGEWVLSEDDTIALSLIPPADFIGHAVLLVEAIDDETHASAAPPQGLAVAVLPTMAPVSALPDQADTEPDAGEVPDNRRIVLNHEP